MTDDMKKDQGQNPGQSDSPDNRNRNKMILQRRILRKTAIRSRMTNRSNRTRAASVALPKLSSGSRPRRRDLYFMRNSLKLNYFQEEICQTTA